MSKLDGLQVSGSSNTPQAAPLHYQRSLSSPVVQSRRPQQPLVGATADDRADLGGYGKPESKWEGHNT